MTLQPPSDQPLPAISQPLKPNALHFLISHNPAFLLSALSMFLGCFLINSALDVRTGDTAKLLALLATINIYEIALLLLGAYHSLRSSKLN
jgi:hypothetical protein